jgi:4-phospho-D-threonate 3-dehydrogenase / 4-phospho-D-erythronate 3-dehydrogenase
MQRGDGRDVCVALAGLLTHRSTLVPTFPGRAQWRLRGTHSLLTVAAPCRTFTGLPEHQSSSTLSRRVEPRRRACEPVGVRAPIAITMGDASGVGPEIVLRRGAAGAGGRGGRRGPDGLDGAFALGDDVVVYGDEAVLRHGADLLGIEWPSSMRVVDCALLRAEDHRPGVLDAASGAAARSYVERATRDALTGAVSAIVTMPMNKEATQLSDPSFVGHTEFIAELCGVERVTMMLTAPTAHGSIAVTHVSTHCSLRDAIERVRPERVLDVIELTDTTLRRFIPRPRIAVCGLNPHAGEHGLFGDEDSTQIAPAIESARSAGIDASGPHPADTVFHAAVHRGRYDAIVCMYHDQGHGPMKLLAFDSGVNVTLGLPIIRTSVDHGTAFDIAWKGEAFTTSLDSALLYARRLLSSVVL